MLGTKEDFELIRQQINIEAVANHLMKKQGKNYIFPSEKSASVRIYPETQSFYDFGRCTGGDVIRLWSHVRDVDSWTALCQIREQKARGIVHIYDGKFLFGDRNKNQSLIMDAHGYEDSGFLGRLEKEYQAATLEDIKISRMSRKEFDTKNAVTRVDEMKKPVELVEVGEDIGIRAKDDVSSSLAARYAKAYSERMSTVNPEFE